MLPYYDDSARSWRALSVLAILTVTVLRTVPAYSQCSGSPPDEVVEAMVAATAVSDAVGSATAIRDCGEFIIVWESVEPPSFDYDNALRVRRYNANGTAMGNLVQLNADGAGYDPSVAMSRLGFAQVGWGGASGRKVTEGNLELIRQGFDFDVFNVVAVTPPLVVDGDGDHHPSVGASDVIEEMENIDAVAWSNHFVEQGLLYEVDDVPVEIRDCAPFCYIGRW